MAGNSDNMSKIERLNFINNLLTEILISYDGDVWIDDIEKAQNMLKTMIENMQDDLK